MENADGTIKETLLTPPQAAKLIGVAHSTIYNGIRDKEIPYTRKRMSSRCVSTTILIVPEDVFTYKQMLMDTGRWKLGRKKQDAI